VLEEAAERDDAEEEEHGKKLGGNEGTRKMGAFAWRRRASSMAIH